MNRMPRSTLRPRTEAILRTIAALPVAYLGAAAASAGAATLLALAGVDRVEAVGWPLLASFIIWLALALYAFGARRVWRAWAVPGGFAIAGTAIVLGIDVGGML